MSTENNSELQRGLEETDDLFRRAREYTVPLEIKAQFDKIQERFSDPDLTFEDWKALHAEVDRRCTENPAFELLKLESAFPRNKSRDTATGIPGRILELRLILAGGKVQGGQKPPFNNAGIEQTGEIR